jgi:alkylation response protein AidB-like acyl-CoA dehydrogenase
VSAEGAKEIQKRIEEYAIECSILKVWGSEMLDAVVDHAVQIYAGYGYVEEYPAERAYRDSRINRIFEGTNEINRLIIAGFVMKRAMTGQLPLLPAIKGLTDELFAPPSFSSNENADDQFSREAAMLVNAKKLFLFACGSASQKYMNALADQQEIMAALADMVLEIYALDSALARARKMAANHAVKASLAQTMTQLYATHAFNIIEDSARRVIAVVAEGDMLRTQLAILRRLAKYEPANAIALGRDVARAAIDQGRYPL